MENNDIYDGVGVIDYNQIQMPLKQVDGMIVTIKSKEYVNGEEKYSFLKGLIKPFDILNFINKSI